jgi:hypothetical protein
MQMMSNLKNNEMFLYPIKLKFATKLIHKMNLYSEDENSLDIEEDRLNRYLPEKFKQRYSVHHIYKGQVPLLHNYHTTASR